MIELLVWIQKLKSRDANFLARATIEALLPFKHLIHTITADNGKEFSQHELISKELGVDVYFAHPYSSWVRGANENTTVSNQTVLPKRVIFCLFDT